MYTYIDTYIFVLVYMFISILTYMYTNLFIPSSRHVALCCGVKPCAFNPSPTVLSGEGDADTPELIHTICQAR